MMQRLKTWAGKREWGIGEGFVLRQCNIKGPQGAVVWHAA